MHPQLSPIRASAAMLLVTSVAAAITASQIVIDQTWITCSFDINTTISEDLTWTIDISTKNSSVDSFAAIGDGANETDARRECYGGSRIYSTGNISEINFGDWDVKGSISLSKGLTAKVALAVYWVFDREEVSDQVLLPHPFSSVNTGKNGRLMMLTDDEGIGPRRIHLVFRPNFEPAAFFPSFKQNQGRKQARLLYGSGREQKDLLR